MCVAGVGGGWVGVSVKVQEGAPLHGYPPVTTSSLHFPASLTARIKLRCFFIGNVAVERSRRFLSTPIFSIVFSAQR